MFITLLFEPMKIVICQKNMYENENQNHGYAEVFCFVWQLFGQFVWLIYWNKKNLPFITCSNN